MIVTMDYRQSGPLRNILPVAILLPAVITLGCVGPGCAPGEPPGAAAAQAAKSSGIRFEPAKGDHSDLAVGETVVERIALVADAPTDWNALEVATSCDCMTARFVDRSDPRKAWVEVEVHGDKVEEIDGMVMAMDASKRDVARYESTVVVKRQPFVQPRKVALEAGGSARFEIVVGQAFPKGKETPIALPLDDVKIGDDSLLAMVDAPEEKTTTEESVILCSRLAFEPNEAARAKPGKVTIALRFGAPVVERVVEVSWPGNH
jgi:hypothetical protein